MGEFCDLQIIVQKVFIYYTPNNILNIYFTFGLETTLSLLDFKHSI